MVALKDKGTREESRQTGTKGRNLKLYKIVVLIAILAVAGYLIFQASRSFMNPYLSVSEVKANPEIYSGKEIQLIGNVTGPLRSGSQGLEFTLTDGSASINVSYSGAIPQNFMEGLRVVIIGKLSSDSSLTADQILTKCPSKYAT
jgi:cytochrome c-type biogenesis protein CcmE